MLFDHSGKPVRSADADKPLSVESITAACAAATWASIRELFHSVPSPLVDANGRTIYSRATKIGNSITVRRPGRFVFADGQAIASKDLD